MPWTPDVALFTIENESFLVYFVDALNAKNDCRPEVNVKENVLIIAMGITKGRI